MIYSYELLTCIYESYLGLQARSYHYTNNVLKKVANASNIFGLTPVIRIY